MVLWWRSQTLTQMIHDSFGTEDQLWTGGDPQIGCKLKVPKAKAWMFREGVAGKNPRIDRPAGRTEG